METNIKPDTGTKKGIKPTISKPIVVNKPIKGKPTRTQMRLPFDKHRRMDWTEWIYRHRVGLLVTVLIYLIGAILFISYRIVLNTPLQPVTYIELVDPEQPEPEQPKPEEPKPNIEQLEQQQFEKVMNRRSNENAKLDAGLKDNSKSSASEVYKEAERVQEQLNAGKSAYEKGLAEIEASAKKSKTPPQTSNNPDGKSEKRERNKVQGNVVVSYNLPGRTDIFLHVPAYQCKGGGRVVIDITVNRNGRVTAATVSKETASADDCMREMATQSALASSFDTSTQDKQKGTITYTFVAQ